MSFSSVSEESESESSEAGTSFQPQERATSLPVIPPEQNGTGLPTQTQQIFDQLGRPALSTDARGVVSSFAYNNATGAMVQQVNNVGSGSMLMAEGLELEAGEGGEEVTDYESDNQGRVLREFGPAHEAQLRVDGDTVIAAIVRKVQYTVYKDEQHQVWNAAGYARGNGPNYTFVTVGAVKLTCMDEGGRVTDEIEAVRVCNTGPLAAEETFPRARWRKWTHQIYDAWGRLLAQRVYHRIPESGEGERNYDYSETCYKYDSMGRQNRVKSPGGTITRTVFDVRGLVASQWVGTDDAGATDTDPTGDGTPGNNMVAVLVNEYDNGEDGGDGLLTKAITPVDGNPANDRIVEFTYDYRSRRVDTITTDGEHEYITRNLYDNLDRVTGVDTYHTSVSAGNLTGRTRRHYDNQGRVYREETYAVDPETGAATVALVGEKWYDQDGNVIRQISPGSEAITLLTYDSLGRQVMSYLAYEPASVSSTSSGSGGHGSGTSESSSSGSGSSTSEASISSSSESSYIPPVSSSSESSRSSDSSDSSATSSSNSSSSSLSSPSSDSSFSSRSSESSSSLPTMSSSGSDSSSSQSNLSSGSHPPSYSSTGGGGGPGGGKPPCNACDEACKMTRNPVRLANGQIVLDKTDLSTRGFVGWAHTRSYGNLLTGQGSGNVGNCWLVEQLSCLVFDQGEEEDLVVATRGVNSSLWFRPAESGGWEPMFGDRYSFVHDAANDRYVMTNPEGYRYGYYDDSPGVPAPLRGQLISYADPYGLVIDLEYDDDYRMVRLDQTDGFQSNTFVYAYLTSGPNAGQMARVSLVINGVPVREAIYDYYGADEAGGSVRDLKRVTIRDYDPTVSAWMTVKRMAYRYYVTGEPNGFVHGLKYVLEPESYARMTGAGLDPMSASDEAWAAYADKYFEYDAERRVSREDVRGGRETYLLGYALNPDAPGYEDHNIWWSKSTETRPDGSVFTLYANKATRSILSKLEDSEGNTWFNYFYYNALGRVMLRAEPSAVESVTEPSGGSTELEVQLHDHQGLLKVTTYYPTTNPGAGAVATYIESEGVQKGEEGDLETRRSVTYATHIVGGVPIYPVASETVYPEAFEAGVTTHFSFAWYQAGESLQMSGFGGMGLAVSEEPDLEDLIVVEQSRTTWNEASEAILSTTWQRFDDAVGTGELNGPGGSEPRARRSYAARWFDGVGRPVATADYGTNGGMLLERPATSPQRSETVLVSSSHYKDDGEANAAIDANGVETRWQNDAAGRRTRLIENYRAGVGATDADANRTTEFAYAPDGGLARLTLINDVTGDQVTRWEYGTTLADSGVATSNLLRTKFFPSASSVVFACGEVGDGAQRIDYRYNRRGQAIEMRDPNGTAHAYDFDLLGRPTQDRVTALGANIDGLVRRIETAYNPKRQQLRTLVTSYSDAEVGEGAVVNEVEFEYDSMNLCMADRQAHAGPVSPETPSVDYQNASGYRNSARRQSMTYPDGIKVIEFLYGPEDGTGDRLSRVEGLQIAGETEPACRYAYMGTARCVEIAYPQPELRLSYRKPAGTPDGDAGDPYNGYDRFGRTVDMRWLQGAGAGTVLDRIQYGYDPAGNRTWRKNLTAPSGGQDQAWTYDGLYQVKTGALGTLNIGLTAIGGVPSRDEAWKYDVTGNWRRWQVAEEGAPIQDQGRVNNRDNQITQIDGSCDGIAYDLAGNTTLIPPDAEGDWSNPQTLKWDAWNRLMEVSVPGGGIVAQYAYDGLYRRTMKVSGAEARHYFYNDQWKCVEERTAEVPASSSSEEPTSSSSGSYSSESVSSESSQSGFTSSSTEWDPPSDSSNSSESSSSSSISSSSSVSSSSDSDSSSSSEEILPAPDAYFNCNESSASDGLFNSGIESLSPLTAWSDPGAVSGKCQGGRQLNGSSGGWFSHDSATVFNPGMSSPLSISLWFKPDELVGIQQIILTKPNEYQLLINGNAELIFQISIDGAVWDAAVSVNLSLTTGEWYNVVAWIIPGDQIGICVNGGTPDVQSLNPDECAYVGGNSLYLGHQSSDSSSSSSYSNSSTSSSSENGPVDFVGSIDEMAFFLRALLPSELESLYNDGDGYFYRSGVWVLCPGSFGAFSAMAPPSSPLLAISALEAEVDRQYVWGARSGHRDELILRDDSIVISSSSISEVSGRLWCLMDYYDPTAVVDNGGNVLERYRFSAFGLRSILNADFSSRLASLCAWDFAFKGQFLDTDTSYYNYGYRYYSPQLGRWLSRDPIEEDGGYNLYGYVRNSPVNKIDLLGLDDVSVTFNRTTLLLTATNDTLKERCSINATSGGWEGHSALPTGTWSVVSNPNGNNAYFALFYHDLQINDQFFDPTETSIDAKRMDPTRTPGRWRDGIRLGFHSTGSTGSHGCIMCVINPSNPPTSDADAWAKIQSWIRSSDKKAPFSYKNNEIPLLTSQTTLSVTFYLTLQVI